MNYEETKKNIEAAYTMINASPVDRLDCLNKSIKLLTILNGGAVFLQEIAMSPHQGEFDLEDLEYIHESFCDSATPLIQMIEHFSERMEKQAREHSLAV